MSIDSRLRYRIMALYGLNETIGLVAFNELWVHSPQSSPAVSFDRNWFATGIEHTLMPGVRFTPQYMFQFAKNGVNSFEQHQTLLLVVQVLQVLQVLQVALWW